MGKQIDVKAVSAVLYGVYKALHSVAGASAPAIMRKAAPDILDELGKLGVSFDGVEDLPTLQEKLSETLVGTGMCEGIRFSETGNELSAEITQCAFYDLTQDLKKEGIEPFGCPFAALTIAMAEKNLGKRARLKRLEPSSRPGDSFMVVELHEK